VAITKTPISTTVILAVIADTSMMPVIVIAAFTSFLLTTQVSLISTQRSRSSRSLESLPVLTNSINPIDQIVDQIGDAVA